MDNYFSFYRRAEHTGPQADRDDDDAAKKNADAKPEIPEPITAIRITHTLTLRRQYN